MTLTFAGPQSRISPSSRPVGPHMFDPQDDFDLDIRFHGDAAPVSPLNFGTGVQCVVPVVPTMAFDNTCGDTCQTCLECEINIVPTAAFENTCQDTCAGQQTCPVHTCGLDCETDTCPDATCGCNTSETCNQDICNGGITAMTVQRGSDRRDV